jgi:hypothetical protein
MVLLESCSFRSVACQNHSREVPRAMTLKWSKDASPSASVPPACSSGLSLQLLGLHFSSLEWFVVLPDGDSVPMAQAALVIAAMLVSFFVVWLVKLVRRTFRVAIHVTLDGVEIARGQTQEFDSYLQCSNFAVLGWTLQWKACTERGVRLRMIAGLNFGMSRNDVKALCALLNTLREAAVAQAQFG